MGNFVPIRPVVLTTEDYKLTVRSRGDLYVNNREQYSAAMQYCYQMLEDLSAEEILQWERIGELYDGMRGLNKQNNDVQLFQKQQNKDTPRKEHLNREAIQKRGLELAEVTKKRHAAGFPQQAKSQEDLTGVVYVFTDQWD